ncbi:MAG: hypothetical protein JO048_17815, partial [Methylobacteriaceae bacterium]|nr:hypothetical protein [Methylobacteriaceae bacterium]
PFGTAHLPADRIDASPTLASTATGADAFVGEALRWLPEADGAPDAVAAPEPEPEPVAIVLTPADPDRPKRGGWWSRAKSAITGA